MLHKLEEVLARFEEINSMLADPSIASDPNQLRKLSKEHSHLQEIVGAYQRFKTVVEEVASSKSLLSDADVELREMAREELSELEPERERLESEIRVMLLPRDPLDDKNIFIEIRKAAGGDEAGLFAGDLLRMYHRYADQRGWRLEITSESPTDLGGYNQVVALIQGKRVYSRLKYEAGTHRVQRIPKTESGGRIHTSTVTVAVLPEADEEVEVEVHESDLRVDTYRASGAGGQHVNKTDSAVRITHEPTGIVVQSQSQRSQRQNKEAAMRELKARLYEREAAAQAAESGAARRAQIGTGDRSERIRTYNYPQSRITDHRIGLTIYKLEKVIDGALDEIVEPLIIHNQAEALQQLGEE